MTKCLECGTDGARLIRLYETVPPVALCGRCRDEFQAWRRMGRPRALSGEPEIDVPAMLQAITDGGFFG